MSITRFPTRFGKYILLDRINSGGMAEVYRAKVTGAEEFQRLIAIKRMLPQLVEDAEFTNMFIDEAKLAAQLSHANIVQIYELGSLHDQLYIAMELVMGRDLLHVLQNAARAQMPVPAGFAVYVVVKAAEALDFAHRKAGVDGEPLNLVHRDVSPQNILVSYDGEVKVVDFGIAKADRRATETRAGILKGKFAYMAPEQVTCGAIDRRTDIFALGAVLYEALTGQKLFRGESAISILDRIRHGVLPDLPREMPAAPDELLRVLRRALARAPDERFAWASEMAEALEPLLIQERSIFGAKRARAFMQSLYADEITELSEKQGAYARVTDADCFEPGMPVADAGATQIFESTFATVAAARGGAPTRRVTGQQVRGGGARTPAPETVIGPTGNDPAAPPPEVARSGTWELPTDKHGAFDPDATVHAAQLSRSVAAQTSGNDTVLAEPPWAEQPTEMQARPVHRRNVPLATGLLAVSALGIALVLLWPHLPTAETPAMPDVMVPVVPIPKLADTSTVPEPAAAALPSDANAAAAPPVPDAEPAPDAPTEAVPHNSVPPPVGRSAAPVRPSAADPAVASADMGFLSVRALGAETARIFIDGRHVGYSPIFFHKVKVGTRRVQAVEEKDGGPGRSKTIDVVVTSAHTRKEPMKLIMPL